jgi:hypothetical protein
MENFHSDRLFKKNFDILGKMVSCFGKTALLHMTFDKKVFYMKMYLRKFLHPNSTTYDRLDNFLIPQIPNGNRNLSAFSFREKIILKINLFNYLTFIMTYLIHFCLLK